MPTIQNRRGTAAQWAAANPTLAAGELGVEFDTHKVKAGDGATPWNDLGYLNDTEVAASIEVHRVDTTDVHGIADTTALATQTYVDTAVGNATSGGGLAPTATATPDAIYMPVRGVWIPKGSLDIWRASRDNHASELVEVVIFGDSTTFGASTAVAGGPAWYSWVQRLRELSVAAGLTDGGRGIAGKSDNTDLALPDTFPVQQSRVGFNVASGGVLATEGFSSDSGGDVVVLQGNGSVVRLHYVMSDTGGGFTYSVDGGVSVPVEALAPGSWASPRTRSKVITITDLVEGLHTVAVTNLGGALIRDPSVNSVLASDGSGTLAAGTYWYSVAAVSANGEGLPVALGSKTLNGTTEKRARFRLNTDAGHTGYRLYRSTSEQGVYGLVTSVTGSYNLGGVADVFDDGSTPPGSAPSTTNNLGRFSNKKNVDVITEFLRPQGIVYQKNAVSGISSPTFFTPSTEAYLYYRAATAFGLDVLGQQPGNTGYSLSPGPSPQFRRVRLGVFALGINDIQGAASDGTGTPDRAVEDGINLFAMTCRAAGADALVVIPHLDAATNAEKYAGRVRRAMLATALAHGCAVVDFSEALGPLNAWRSKNYVGANGSVNANPHLSKFAYEDEAEFLWDNCLSL